MQLNYEQQENQQNISINQESIQLRTKIPLYQLWPGRNSFICWGKVISGSSENITHNILVWILIIFVPMIYFFEVSKHLLRIHPYLLIQNIVLLFMAQLFLCLTQFTEPGIIPRKEIQLLTQNNFSAKTDVNNKFCETCKINRPQRTSHCKICDNCVRTFDHHCIFINNCIGKRNYQFFIAFMISLVSLIISVVAGLIVYTNDTNMVSEQNLQVSLSLIRFLVIMVSILGVVLLFFMCFHLFLIIRGKTTHEQLKQIQCSPIDNEEIDWFVLSKSLFQPRQLILVD